jgi:hypothetical protein
MQKRSTSRDAYFTLRVLIGCALATLGVFLAVIAFGLYPGESLKAAQPKTQPWRPHWITVHSSRNDVSAPLREMATWKLPPAREEETSDNPKVGIVRASGSRPDTAVQKTFGQRLLASILPGLNFDGIPFPGVVCSCAPPDTDGYVGQTQYVAIVNEGYQVFDKTTGNSILGPASIRSVWAGFGGVCQTGGNGDPVMLYDKLANRWVISQFAEATGTSVPNQECVAVSTTSDATGTYNRYDFDLRPFGANFYDYPKLGSWPDAYYASFNVFNSAGTAFLGPQAFAMDRTNMLAGNPATIVSPGIAVNGNEDPLMPSDFDGKIMPPSGAPNVFVEFPDPTGNNGGHYRYWQYSVGVPFNTNPTFTQFTGPTAAAFTFLCPTTRACVPELGVTSANYVDGIGDRLMFRLAYRNFGSQSAPNESWVSNFSVNSGGVAAPRWFELKGLDGANGTINQEGTYQPDSTWRWMGSVAMDQSGDLALGYSASSSTINPQIRYATRVPTDPLGTLTAEADAFNGTGSQTGTANRWGDYSAMTVDPVDDCTFWYTQEYYSTTSTFNWRTRIMNFKFSTCGSAGVTLVSAASRLTHASAGTFDVNMPLTGTSGVEDRMSSTYNAVFTFSGPVTSGQATVISGTGTAGAPTFSGSTMTVPLSGVADQQVITIQVSNINGDGQVDGSVPFGFLVGDYNADRFTNGGDTTSVRGLSGATVNAGDFRADVNLDGFINSGDATIVRSKSGDSIP